MIMTITGIYVATTTTILSILRVSAWVFSLIHLQHAYQDVGN